MPSWNLHTAHTERLLQQQEPSCLGIRDTNCFLFGNFVPDIYVGYMVKPVSRLIPYTTTHFSRVCIIPVPCAQAFWNAYIQPSVDQGEAVDDMVLGAWAHLVADGRYNANTRMWLDEKGIQKGEAARIMKQGDFEKFGRTLYLTMKCQPTDALIAQGARFPQYKIEEDDIQKSILVANGIVDATHTNHIPGTPKYELFCSEWFERVGREVDEIVCAGLTRYAKSLKDNA